MSVASIQTYPRNLRQILIEAVQDVVEHYDLTDIDAEAIADRELAEPAFQTTIACCFAGIDVLEEDSEEWTSAVWACFDYMENILAGDLA